MNNEPVALVNNMCNDSIDWKVDPLKLEEGTPLYTHEQITASGFLNASEPVYPAKTLTDEEIEKVRVAIMGAAYWCADENMSEAYNAIKVCCGQVLGILVKAQEK
jgi:hypothetical protein